MTYLTLKATGLPKNRIIGMGGALDSSRFKTYLSLALEKPANDIQGMVIGGHGDTTMIPLTRLASYNGLPVSQILSKAQLDQVAADTMVGGATLTKLLGTSAWYAPDTHSEETSTPWGYCAAGFGLFGGRELGHEVAIRDWRSFVDPVACGQDPFRRAAWAWHGNH